MSFLGRLEQSHATTVDGGTAPSTVGLHHRRWDCTIDGGPAPSTVGLHSRRWTHFRFNNDFFPKLKTPFNDVLIFTCKYIGRMAGTVGGGRYRRPRPVGWPLPSTVAGRMTGAPPRWKERWVFLFSQISYIILHFCQYF